jgi:hypothetical protein
MSIPFSILEWLFLLAFCFFFLNKMHAKLPNYVLFCFALHVCLTTGTGTLESVNGIDFYGTGSVFVCKNIN